MLKNPLPAGKRGPYFEGWYFKNTNHEKGISFIQGINIEGEEKKGLYTSIPFMECNHAILWFKFTTYNNAKLIEYDVDTQINTSTHCGVEIVQ